MIPSEEDTWISESFAEYCASLLIRKVKGEDDFRVILAHWKADAQNDAAWKHLPQRAECLRDGARAGVCDSTGSVARDDDGRESDRLAARETIAPPRRGRGMEPRTGIVGVEQQVDVRDDHGRQVRTGAPGRRPTPIRRRAC